MPSTLILFIGTVNSDLFDWYKFMFPDALIELHTTNRSLKALPYPEHSY